MPRRPAHPPGLPAPSRDRGTLLVLVAGLLAAAGFVLLALTSGGKGGTSQAAALPAAPPITVAAPVPAPAPTPQAVPAPVRQAAAPKATSSSLDERRFRANDRTHVRRDWVAGFFPLYERSAAAHGVSWLLLASIHKQETGFSTHETTYRGLNFARCCAGPMQFNVTNGPVSTWERFRGSYKAAERPASYNHMTDRHPSPYDDFDAMMAAGALLRTSGAGRSLDASAWRAAYDYYGHDLTGIEYASQVVARAMQWGRQGFCVNCATDPGIVAAVDAAWGAPVRSAMVAAEAEAERRRRAGERARAAAKDAG